MPDRRAVIAFLCAAPMMPMLPTAALAGRPEIFAEGGLAIRGTDPVAYFRAGRPTPGDRRHAVAWRGATWLFASAANREAFEMNPEGHAPRYGGYCAYALAQGALASTVPEAWTIHEGRLYLNYSVPVRTLWQEDIPGNVRAADRHWPGILG